MPRQSSHREKEQERERERASFQVYVPYSFNLAIRYQSLFHHILRCFTCDKTRAGSIAKPAFLGLSAHAAAFPVERPLKSPRVPRLRRLCLFPSPSPTPRCKLFKKWQEW